MILDVEALLPVVARELNAAQPIQSQIPPFEAFSLCAALQLAWRHPALSELQRSMIEKAARDLQAAVRARSSAAGELLELGWDQTLDVPPAPPASTSDEDRRRRFHELSDRMLAHADRCSRCTAATEKNELCSIGA